MFGYIGKGVIPWSWSSSISCSCVNGRFGRPTAGENFSKNEHITAKFESAMQLGADDSVFSSVSSAIALAAAFKTLRYRQFPNYAFFQPIHFSERKLTNHLGMLNTFFAPIPEHNTSNSLVANEIFDILDREPNKTQTETIRIRYTRELTYL